jgi:hypothetical protein
MMFHLNKEQTDEDAHKNWCDTEMETTEQSLNEKADKIKKLNAKKEELIAAIDKFEREIQEEEQNLADSKEYVKEQTELRNTDKKENAKTLEDAKKAQVAVTKAITVLTQFYKSSGGMVKEDYEFIQQEPDTGFASGDSFGSSGHTEVMNTLEKALEDYSTLEAETATAEEEQSVDFDTAMSDAKIAQTKFENEIKNFTARKTAAEKKKTITEKSLKKTSDQQHYLNEYDNDLNQPCRSVDEKTGEVITDSVKLEDLYKARKTARSNEIQGLKDALKVLKNAFKEKEEFVQQTSRSFLARV